MKTFDEFWADVSKYKLHLIYPQHIYKQAFEGGEVNGCGSKGGVKVPDSLWGLLIFASCGIHDTEWHMATSEQDLIIGNINFRRNMETTIDMGSNNWFAQWARLRTMSRYYRMVKLVGTPAEAKKRGFTDAS